MGKSLGARFYGPLCTFVQQEGAIKSPNAFLRSVGA